MAEISWLADAVNRPIDPTLRIMHPSKIRYEWLEPPVRDLVRALNEGGVVETLASCGGHPFDATGWLQHAHSAFVQVHVLDKAAWCGAVLAVADVVQPVIGLTLSVTFGHEAILRIGVPPWAGAVERRELLDYGLERATSALRRWNASQYGVAAD